MAVKLTISFKANAGEQRLLEHLNKKRNKSDYIKDLIEKDMKGKTEEKEEEKEGGFVW